MQNSGEHFFIDIIFTCICLTLCQTVLKKHKIAAGSKAFCTFESMQILWGKISIATKLKKEKYEKVVLDKYIRIYIYWGWEGCGDYVVL